METTDAPTPIDQPDPWGAERLSYEDELSAFVDRTYGAEVEGNPA